MKNKFKMLSADEYLKFYNSLQNAKKRHEYGCFLSSNPPEFYADTQNFMLGDQIAGFAINGKDIIAAHKNPQLARSANTGRVLDDIMLLAFEMGGETLDCYGEHLAQAYMCYGFLPVAKIKFDIKYNPDWDAEKFGTPDVIAMLSGTKGHEDLEYIKSLGKLKKITELKDVLPEFNNYEEMLSYRDGLLHIKTKNNLSYREIFEIISEVVNEQYCD